MVGISSLSATLLGVYDRLFRQHGPQGWWPAESDFEVVVGAVLTQSVSWRNVEKALDNLRAAGALSPAGIRELSAEDLAALVRPTGYHNTKARKLHAFMEFLASYGDDLSLALSGPRDVKRRELLAVYGVGEETADAILVYAGRAPSFVIDAYTRRILSRLGLATGEETYEALQRLFEDNLPQDAQLFNEYHALLDTHAKRICAKRAPACGGCSLLEVCPTGRGRVHGAGQAAPS
jgi:endonuclease-3 related protein